MSRHPNAVVSEITLDWLIKQGASEDQRELFCAVFGDRAELTRANLDRAVSERLDLDWLAKRLLTPPARAAYKSAIAPARAAHEAATDPAWAAYEAARETAWQVYSDSLASIKDAALSSQAYIEAKVRAWQVREQADQAAWEIYKTATAPDWRRYLEAVTRILAESLDLPGEDQP